LLIDRREENNRKWRDTYTSPAIIPINTGTPTPTLTPMISLLLTPFVFPLRTPVSPVPPVGEEVGTKETGLPLVELIAFTFVPKGMVVTAVLLAAVMNVAFEPEGTTETSVFVTVLWDVDCRDAGQFRSPVERHKIAVLVYVTSVLVVVELAAFLAVIEAPVAAVLTVPVTAHAAARVVKKSGTWVFGLGPHVWPPSATVAPALAPSSIVYSWTTGRSHLLPLLEGVAVTFVTNWATSAKTAATIPVLNCSVKSAMVTAGGGVLKSTPAVIPTRSRAVRTTPEVWIVTGKNSKFPPLLNRGN